MSSPLIQSLIEAFQVLPGVGPKSAQRMAFYLLERNRNGASRLADVLRDAVQNVGHCESCRTLTEEKVCQICASNHRDATLLCVVESPADIAVIEASGAFNGKYFVLMGHLSPIDGIGPAELGLELLEARLDKEPIQELIVATNPTVEGEATAHYIQQLADKYSVTVSRPAQGIPVGGELEYLDSSTLSQAFLSRKQLL
ncbi:MULTISPECIES: recombination mediator RecR [Thiomicrorhabdus]|uniref:Recombination protein RecR n=1 Tax=Thiomicrorhabdus heinhorstiae TaxID=2748010 RepID=A0ABS0BXY2_9GAMM|nr:MULTISPECIES: recombination mediator RecR [Thiomicrorhabdus]MBF6058647.1 recombination protein RecR [Thiomicrorhabdus heinhorstiae]